MFSDPIPETSSPSRITSGAARTHAPRPIPFAFMATLAAVEAHDTNDEFNPFLSQQEGFNTAADHLGLEGGVRDVLSMPDFHTEKELYYARLVWDFIFFVVVVIILLVSQ